MEIQKSIDVIAFYEIIDELDQCLRLRFPEFYAHLLPGLTEAELLEFGAELGVTLPEDYKILYGWKNGSGFGELPLWNGIFLRDSAVTEYRSLYRWLQITVLVLSNPENYDEGGEFDSESGFAMARAINGYPVFFPEPLPPDLPNCFTTS